MTASSAAAQTPSSTRELRVAVMPIPPLVMQENGSLTGFNIDLWNAIAAQLQLKTDYQVLPDIASLLESMRSKNADVVVSPIVITAARDKEFDFSLPTMQAGFQIMVRATGEAAAPDPLADLLILLFSKTTAVPRHSGDSRAGTGPLATLCAHTNRKEEKNPTPRGNAGAADRT